MRILHVEDYVAPQLGYQTVYIAKYHKRLGHDVRILSSISTRPFQSFRWIPKEFPTHEVWNDVVIDRVRIAGDFCGRPWLSGVERYISEFSPDVVVAHGTMTLTSLRIMVNHLFRASYTLVVDDHMTFRSSARRGRAVFYSLIKTPLGRRLLGCVDVFVAVSEETRDFMVEHYGLPPHRVTVIPLGVDDEVFQFDEKLRHRFRQEMGFHENDVVVVYAGKFTRTKDPGLLVDAFTRARSVVPNIKLLIVGDGDRTYVEETFRRVGGGSKPPEWLAWVRGVPNSDLPMVYSASDIGCWPRASSLTMLEAMSCGVPVIVSDQKAAAERVREGGGIAYPEGDVDRLTESIVLLATNPRLRIEMGRQAREIVRRKLSWRLCANRFLEAAFPSTDRQQHLCHAGPSSS